MDRRLAAVLSADIAGYSRLMGEDEEATVRALQVHMKAIGPLILEHGGRVMNTAGDSVLAEFGSVVGAVSCAVAVQNLVRKLNEGVPSQRRLAFRIGVNQGEIVADGADIYGDGINVAARLQALAQPGGVSVSDRVHEDVAGKVGLEWRDTGQQTLKNITRPVRVWEWDCGGVAVTPSPGLPLPDRPSIAVLPFDNLSSRPDDRFFSDGITEDIIAGLSRFRTLFVVAHNSSFAFRDQAQDLAQIGRQLGVAYILEGSVRRSGERVRITARLIEAQSGQHLWAERYDRGLTEIFAVQDEVATAIVSMLVGQIQQSRIQKNFRHPTESLAAYDLCLRGIAEFRSYAAGSNERASSLFEQAIARDPDYALAHAYSGMATAACHGYIEAPKDVIAAACLKARRAVDLDPQNAVCQRMLGHLLLYSRQYDLSEHHSRRAVELNSNDADSLIGLGFVLTQRGQPEEGLVWAEKAMRSNPLHPPWYHYSLAAAFYGLRRYADAVRELKHLPDVQAWRFRLAACYGQLGHLAEAAEERSSIMRTMPNFSADTFVKTALSLERIEDREHLRDGLLKAGLPG